MLQLALLAVCNVVNAGDYSVGDYSVGVAAWRSSRCREVILASPRQSGYIYIEPQNITVEKKNIFCKDFINFFCNRI